MKLFFNILVLWSSTTLISGSNILGVFPFCSHSHFILGFRLMKELVDRGHTVTLISCFPQKQPIKNLKDVSVAELMQKRELGMIMAELLKFSETSYWGKLNWLSKAGKVLSLYILQMKPVQDLMRSNDKFDAVIMENFVTDALSIFQHRFNCPLILANPGPNTMFNNHLVANPWNPSYIPNLLVDYGTKMNFWQRLQNTYQQVVGELFVHFIHIPEQNRILKQVFPDAPDLHTILYNVSFLFLCSHVSLSDPVPLQRNVVQIGGYHVEPPKPLPKNIQQFLDSAKKGVIVFSMGSVLKNLQFDEEKKKAIFKVFSKITPKVICAFDNYQPQEHNENLMVLDWLPQQDILAHPNVIGLVSHGGLLGTIEAVYYGVPILGLPIFGDQGKNTEAAVQKGYGLRLDFKDVNEETFSKTLNEFIYNQKYRRIAKERSKIMHDQPIKQMDEAVFWIEYVITHKGAHHLRSKALNLKWYQRYLVDVILFVATILTIFILAIRFTVKSLFGKKNGSSKKIKKN